MTAQYASRPPDAAQAPPIAAALRHAAQRWLPAVLAADGGARAATACPPLPTPITAALLRWWFAPQHARQRAENFHPVQREAIVHTVLAHEVLRVAEAQALFRAACGVGAGNCSDDDGRRAYALHLLPHGGVRWVMQALLLWQWANHAATTTPDPRFAADLRLLADDADNAARLRDALLGPVGARDIAGSSLLRHAALFLPPWLRADCARWLREAAQGEAATDAHPSVHCCTDGLPGLRLVCGGRLHVHWQPAHIVGDAARSAVRVPAIGAANAEVIAEAGLSAAIAQGAAKPLLLPQWSGPWHLPRRFSCSRPVLPRALQGALACALDTLAHLRAGLAPLAPPQPVQGWVLCDTPALARAAASWLRRQRSRRAHAAALRIAQFSDTPPPGAHPGVGVIVLLRARRGPLPEAWLGAALVPQWRTPACSALRAQDRERIARGQPPHSLLDALWLVDAAEHLPAAAPRQAQGHWLEAALATGAAWRWPRGVALPPAAGPLRRVLPRRDATLAIPLPVLPATNPDTDALLSPAPVPMRADAADSPYAPGSGLSAAAPRRPDRVVDRRVDRRVDRLVDLRHAAPTRRSQWPWLGWPADSRGLHRGLIEAAEADPAVEAYTLLDGTTLAGTELDGTRPQGMRLERLPHGLDAPAPDRHDAAPDALVRTAVFVYAVALEEAAAPGAVPAPGAGKLADWCRAVSALPAAARGGRVWRAVLLPAPAFWRWKRRGTPLSVLLAALADGAALAATLTAQRPRDG